MSLFPVPVSTTGDIAETDNVGNSSLSVKESDGNDNLVEEGNWNLPVNVSPTPTPVPASTTEKATSRAVVTNSSAHTTDIAAQSMMALSTESLEVSLKGPFLSLLLNQHLEECIQYSKHLCECIDQAYNTQLEEVRVCIIIRKIWM